MRRQLDLLKFMSQTEETGLDCASSDITSLVKLGPTTTRGNHVLGMNLTLKRTTSTYTVRHVGTMPTLFRVRVLMVRTLTYLDAG